MQSYSTKEFFEQLRSQNYSFTNADLSLINFTQIPGFAALANQLALASAQLTFTECNLTGATLGGLAASSLSFSRCDLSAAVLDRIEVSYLQLSHISKADGLSLEDARLHHCDIDYSNLERVSLAGTYVFGPTTRNNSIDKLRVTSSVLKNANMQNMAIPHAYIFDSNFSGAQLQKSYLEGSQFLFCTVEGMTYNSSFPLILQNCRGTSYFESSVPTYTSLGSVGSQEIIDNPFGE